MPGEGSRTTLIVTMAGAGLRFRSAGHVEPKYRIAVHGQSLFAWSQSSLRLWIEAGAQVVYVTRAGEGAAPFIDDQCRALGIARRSIVELAEPTSGQATTALAASDAIRDWAAPVAIYNIDTYVHPAYLDPERTKGDGWIPCFPGEGNAWSFARTDASDRVLEVREKLRIGPHATVGFYWFSSLELYRQAYRELYELEGRMDQPERYVAPLYNQLLASGRPCFIGRVPSHAVVPLGTPAEVDAFARTPLLPSSE